MEMSNENENLDELLSSFYDERETNEFKNNLKSFEDMFGSGPVSSGGMIDEIKTAVAIKLSSRKHNRSAVLRRIAVAAVIIIVGLAGVKMGFRRDISPDTSDVALTAGLFDDGETSQITLLTEQIEQIEDALLSVRLDEYDSYGDDSYFELETELNEINGDFWKG